MAYTPKAIANFFLDKAESEGKKLTPLQVIKLVFIAHGWCLALKGYGLVNETPQAWKYGPVFPSLYKEFKRFGDDPIVRPSGTFGGSLLQRAATTLPPRTTDIKLYQLLDRVWSEYGDLSGSQLSTLTHQIDSPWEITWNELDAKNTTEVEIPEFLIKGYYQKLLSGNVRS